MAVERAGARRDVTSQSLHHMQVAFGSAKLEGAHERTHGVYECMLNVLLLRKSGICVMVATRTQAAQRSQSSFARPDMFDEMHAEMYYTHDM